MSFLPEGRKKTISKKVPLSIYLWGNQLRSLPCSFFFSLHHLLEGKKGNWRPKDYPSLLKVRRSSAKRLSFRPHALFTYFGESVPMIPLWKDEWNWTQTFPGAYRCLSFPTNRTSFSSEFPLIPGNGSKSRPKSSDQCYPWGTEISGQISWEAWCGKGGQPSTLHAQSPVQKV